MFRTSYNNSNFLKFSIILLPLTEYNFNILHRKKNNFFAVNYGGEDGNAPRIYASSHRSTTPLTFRVKKATGIYAVRSTHTLE